MISHVSDYFDSDGDHHCIHGHSWFGKGPPGGGTTRRDVLVFVEGSAEDLRHCHVEWTHIQ